MSYNICPGCGAHLDPSEICEDCINEMENKRIRINQIESLMIAGPNGQYMLALEVGLKKGRKVKVM